MTAGQPPHTDETDLDRALDQGELDELPPNQLRGFLGERGPDMRKTDTFRDDMNAGLLQESTSETRTLTVVLLYVIVLTSPIAFYLLWRDRRMSTGMKTGWTVVMAAGLIALAWALLRG
jgi:hypothetical protein